LFAHNAAMAFQTQFCLTISSFLQQLLAEVLDFMTNSEPFLYVVLVKNRPTLSLRPVVKAVLRVCLVFIW